MSATIQVRLVSPSAWSSGSNGAAVAEVVPAPGKRAGSSPATKATLGVNEAARDFPVMPGEYLVRAFMPSGDVQAELVRVGEGATEKVDFEVRASPHEWLGAEFNLGLVQRLPGPGTVQALQAALPEMSVRGLVRGSGVPGPRRQAVALRSMADLQSSMAAVEGISGYRRAQQIAGWLWFSRIDRERPLPTQRLPLKDLVRWWTGEPDPAAVPLSIVQGDDYNARLAASVPTPDDRAFVTGQRRAFAALRDPTGAGYYAVYPAGWRSTTHGRIGETVPPNVLMTVVVDTVLNDVEGAATPARWRCAPGVGDVEAMSYLGFLHAGKTDAADVLLDQAQDWLFRKTVNPVAAAAGAYGLLTHSEAANARQRPEWRDWIKNLYHGFPMLPDGAIAMAQLAMRHGETGSAEEIDVERLRGHALEAVRRGLPYLTHGVHLLAELLLLLVRDDESAGRSGAAVTATRRARALVQQLGRSIAPDAFFTVVRLGREQEST